MSAELASFIPYRRCAEGWEFYLQKRDSNAPTHPNVFSTFGGHLEEGEDSLEGILREIKEELVYVPERLILIGSDVYNGKHYDAYAEEVGDDFENNVTVLEGEYGAFLSLHEVHERDDVTDLARDIVDRIVAAVDSR